MGQVYEVYDPRLRRRVALKVLRAGGAGRYGSGAERFVREGRAQAAVRHPGVCPVFEVGEAEGSPYIVMQLVDGVCLDEAARGLPLERILLLLQQVAEAVHAAHRTGLIHRDLKPANVLVETSAEGPLRPFVLDFGLARTAEGGLTLEGDQLGTPHYMAPEQVRGETERIDRRTDVFALGATLYRLLAGRPPFPGEGTGAMVACLEEEPAPLRPFGVPVEVEAVVFKCLEKDPERRYGSARALAEDLGRYLDGRPVEARPAGRLYRLGKLLRRHRPLVAVAAVSAALLLGALLWAAAAQIRAGQRERLAREFTEQVEELEAEVRYSHLSPLHDVGPDRERLRRRMEAIRHRMDEAGGLARGVGLYSLGRGHLALEELDEAHERLTAAWDAGYRRQEAAVALALTFSALYREELGALEVMGDWDGRRRQLQELDETFGAPARFFLERSRLPGEAGPGTLEPALSEAPLVEALLLFHGDRYEEALETLAQAAPALAWEYEVPRLEGDLRRTWAVKLSAAGDDDRAREELDRALEAYARAGAVAESDAGVHRARAQAAYLRLSLDLLQEGLSPAILSFGMESVHRALAAEPRDPRGWLWKARLHRLQAQHQRLRSEDPTAELALAVEAAEAAAGLAEPSSDGASQAWKELGRAHWSWAQWLGDRGQDPAGRIDLTAQALDRVGAGDRDFDFWMTAGRAQMTLGDHRASRGLDPREAYGRAAAAYTAASRVHSAPFGAWSNLGLTLFKASAVAEAEDSAGMLEQALEAFERARSLKPESVVPHYYLGRCRLRLAQGGDPASGRLDLGPEGGVEEAVAHYERALEIAPGMFQLHSALGEAFHLRALDAADRGEDPQADFEAARQAYERGLELAPEHPVLVLNLGWTAYFQGKVRMRAGEDPGPYLPEAARLCGRALAASGEPGARLCLASARRLQGEWAFRQGRDPSPDLAAARTGLEELIAVNPRHAEAHRSLGRLWTLEARWRQSRGGDPAEALDRAGEALDRALELEPERGANLLAKAQWFQARGLQARGQQARAASGGSGEAATEALAQALDLVRRARLQRPRWQEALQLEAGLLEARWQEEGLGGPLEPTR